MEQVIIGGSNQVFPPIPAGPAVQSVAGAANVTLPTNVGASDIIELTGLLTGNIVVTIPLPLSPQVVGTSGPFSLVTSWIKLVRNNTAGPFSVTVKGPGGVGVLVAQGSSNVLFSEDGSNVFSSGSGSPVGLFGGAQIVFKPGTPTSGNAFATWAEVVSAFNASLIVNDFVSIGFDGSASGGAITIPTGVVNFFGRVRLFLASGLSAIPVITGAPGCQLQNVMYLDAINIQNSPAALVPLFLWDASTPLLYTINATNFTNDPNSGQPFATFTGPSLNVYAFTSISFSNGAVGVSGAMFALPPGGVLVIVPCLRNMNTTDTIGTAGFSTGNAASSLYINADVNFGPVLYPQSAAWLGATIFTQAGKISKTVAVTANGNFIVPLGVTEIDVEGAGGGGGGSGGNAGSAGAVSAGGSGGAGAPWQKRTLRGLVQLSVLPSVIGIGGAGGAAGPAAGPSSPGLAGGQTTLGALLAFDGGSGGAGTTGAMVGGLGGLPLVGPGQANVIDSVSPGSSSPLFAGAGGKGGGGAVAAGIGARNGGLFAGGIAPANQANSASGGGGGAGPYGAGGAGGAAPAGAAIGVVGGAGSANTGAGAGGGSSGNGAGNAGGAGGNGGSGVLFITWRLSP